MSLKIITVPDVLCQLSYTEWENYTSLPIQFLGPAENGRNAKGWRPLIFSGRKRSGSKSNGAGHTSGFLCKARVEMVTADPFGRKKSPGENACSNLLVDPFCIVWWKSQEINSLGAKTTLSPRLSPLATSLLAKRGAKRARREGCYRKIRDH